MTAVQPVTPVCPECGGTNTMVLSDGMGKCFDDGHEWDPAQVTALPRPEIEPFQMASVDEVFGPPPGVDPEPGTLTHDEMVGGTARLEGGQVAQVLSFPDDDHVMVRLNDGRDELVPMSEVERITPRAPEYVIEPEDDTAKPFEQASEEAGQIIQAVSTAIDQVGEGPLTELVVTMAICRMMLAYEIEIEDLTETLGLVAQSLRETDEPEVQG